MAQASVQVEGLRELTRAFRKISKDLSRELTKELKEAAEPVRKAGEELALGKIRNMPRSPHWAGMRIGVSAAKGAVYMVPQARRRGGSGRPNLNPLMMERAMQPALDQNESEVVDHMDKLLGRLAGENGF